jgi:hypothetical protein
VRKKKRRMKKKGEINEKRNEKKVSTGGDLP